MHACTELVFPRTQAYGCEYMFILRQQEARINVSLFVKFLMQVVIVVDTFR